MAANQKPSKKPVNIGDPAPLSAIAAKLERERRAVVVSRNACLRDGEPCESWMSYEPQSKLPNVVLVEAIYLLQQVRSFKATARCPKFQQRVANCAAALKGLL